MDYGHIIELLVQKKHESALPTRAASLKAVVLHLYTHQYKYTLFSPQLQLRNIKYKCTTESPSQFIRIYQSQFHLSTT